MTRDAWRIFEIFLCAVSLLILSPVLMVAAVAIWIEDGFPILFRQTRMGMNGVPFRLLKLRTMRSGLGGPKITSAADRRVTATGAILLRYKLDEIPQLWNVLRGDMSLVGPRPEVPEYVDYENSTWRRILARRPGITDVATLVHRNEAETLAQFPNPERGYSDFILPQKLAISLEYESCRTFFSDTRLLFLTVRYSIWPSGHNPKAIRSKFLHHE
jgi:lipopolysaccharide/colanic/teichoic acid biosynthesis glycosyltransferase